MMDFHFKWAATTIKAKVPTKGHSRTLFLHFLFFLTVNIRETNWIWTRVLNLSGSVRCIWAVVVAQWVERSLPIREVRCLNPVIVKYLHIEHLFTVNCIEKTKITTKEDGNGLLKKTFWTKGSTEKPSYLNDVLIFLLNCRPLDSPNITLKD